MPIKKYDRYLGNANKVMAALKSEYGDKKGTSVFYAMVNKRKNKKK